MADKSSESSEKDVKTINDPEVKMISWIEDPIINYERDTTNYTVSVSARFPKMRFIKPNSKVKLSDPIKLEELEKMLEICSDEMDSDEIEDLKYIINTFYKCKEREKEINDAVEIERRKAEGEKQ